MTIRECEREAQQLGYDRCTFVAKFPAGKKKCRWGDAYMGLFMIEGIEGFSTVNKVDHMFPGLECFDLTLLTDEESAIDMAGRS